MFRNREPVAWYLNMSQESLLRLPKAEITKSHILSKFSDPNINIHGEVVALLYTPSENSESTEIEYLVYEDVASALGFSTENSTYKFPKAFCILQEYIRIDNVCRSESVIQSKWSQNFTFVTQRSNKTEFSNNEIPMHNKYDVINAPREIIDSSKLDNMLSVQLFKNITQDVVKLMSKNYIKAINLSTIKLFFKEAYSFKTNKKTVYILWFENSHIENTKRKSTLNLNFSETRNNESVFGKKTDDLKKFFGSKNLNMSKISNITFRKEPTKLALKFNETPSVNTRKYLNFSRDSF